MSEKRVPFHEETERELESALIARGRDERDVYKAGVEKKVKWLLEDI